MTSDPRAPSAERLAELTAVIRADISSNPSGRITFDRFMARALYEPGLGYYRQSDPRPTREGDFLTAPETHPIFGWALARWLEARWEELGRPEPFTILEYGAGAGTLGLAVLEGFARHGANDLVSAVHYQPLESNPHRRADIRDRFEKAGHAGRLILPGPSEGAGGTRGDGLVPVTGVLLANEFLDALPVHRVVVRGGELRELFVEWREGRFCEVAAEPSTPELAARLALDAVSLAEGQIAEICLELDPWLREAAGLLARGSALIVDYGFEAAELYGPRHFAGTLLGYRGHRVVDEVADMLAAPGGVDLTAHVDFTALRLIAERRGFRTVSLNTQSEFLVAAGLEAELQALQASPDLTASEYLAARSAIVRLLDPRHLGRFGVLTLEK